MRLRLFVQALAILCLFTAGNAFADQKCEPLFAKTPQRLSIKNQGCNPVCGWFARTSLFEEAIFKQEGKVVNFSAEAYLATNLTNDAIWRVNNSYEYFNLEDHNDLLNRIRHFAEYRFIHENDWKLSEEYSNRSVERFIESVDAILKSKMPKEDKIENINAASKVLFGHRISGEDYVAPFRNIRLSVNSEMSWYRSPITYKDLTEDTTIEIMQDTTPSVGMDIIDRVLKEGRPVLVGIKWIKEHEDREKGIVSIPFYKELDKDGDNHAVLIYKKDWRGRYYFINSWGEAAGQKGHYYVTGGYLKKALQAIEVLIPTKPTE